MQYLYYKSDIPNFGDELNGWLWDKLFPKTTDDNYFLGMGTVLHKDNITRFNLQPDLTKIVFGTGIRGFNSEFSEFIDDTWDIRFLRGPLSALALGNKYPYITDGAYAVRQTDFFRQIKDSPKKYKVSLMPHFCSVKLFNWEKLCKELGWHYISPCCGVENIEQTLREIAVSEKIISEAMHGAILADIFRVPWARFAYNTCYAESIDISEFKWNDWLYSVDLYSVNFVRIPIDLPSKIIRKITNKKHGNISQKKMRKILDDINRFYSSSEEIINIIDNKIVEQIKILKDK